ncbi:MAG TPA: hypothetical protein VMB77_09370 [Syntrophales bacterium]|nr:hypothetical protein [Syntrophales bacterium]
MRVIEKEVALNTRSDVVVKGMIERIEIQQFVTQVNDVCCEEKDTG